MHQRFHFSTSNNVMVLGGRISAGDGALSIVVVLDNQLR